MGVKKILITGCTHGIGRQTAEVFLEQNWEVYGCAGNRGERRGLEMQQRYRNFHFRYADVSCEGDVAEIAAWCGAVDAAFNNAGIGCKPVPVHLMDTGNAKRILEVNLLGTALCMKYECAVMLRGAGGVIVNNASIAAAKAATNADIMYAASKAGILRLTAEAAVEREYRDHIKFFSVIPGWIETRMTAEDDKAEWARMLPSGRAGEPIQVAELVFGVIANADRFVSGQEFYVDGGGRLI